MNKRRLQTKRKKVKSVRRKNTRNKYSLSKKMRYKKRSRHTKRNRKIYKGGGSRWKSIGRGVAIGAAAASAVALVGPTVLSALPEVITAGGELGLSGYTMALGAGLGGMLGARKKNP